MKSLVSRPHFAPLALLFGLCLLFWGRVLFTAQVLLPGAMLRGFAPFGGDSSAPWTILQWDALAQYFPWRHYAAEQLRSGQIPLWNPLQFSGTPFVANAQSAVFYPLNLPFWIFDTARAFGIAALLHSVLASFGCYFLVRRWGLSRAAGVIAGAIYAFCGYLSAWAPLPTLFATAAWLPLCLLLFERASDDEAPRAATLWLGLSLACALLAGHPQVFFYILLALAVRQPFLRRKWRGLAILIGSITLALLLGAIQVLPTLELSRISHRGPSADWKFWQDRALQPGELRALLLPAEPTQWGTLNENFGYIGLGALLLGLLGLFHGRRRLSSKKVVPPAAGSFDASPPASFRNFSLALAVFGLLYALATPVSQLIFIAVPGVSQMGAPGRAFLLWSLGVALMAAFGLDFARTRVKSRYLAPVALAFIAAELGFNAQLTLPTAPRATVYPPTTLTSFLAKNSGPNARVLMLTPRQTWLPTEGFRPPRTHPIGVLPPNGAMVYGIYDVNGYDSLSLRQYRAWLASEEPGGTLSPGLNGNMVLLNSLSPTLLDSLAVRYVVAVQGQIPLPPPGELVLTSDGCEVWERRIQGQQRVGGPSFSPGWREGQYQPTSFRLGGFLSLCALAFVAAALVVKTARKPHQEITGAQITGSEITAAEAASESQTMADES